MGNYFLIDVAQVYRVYMIWELLLPCIGPDSRCPHSCRDHTVVLCQGDMMLCPSCTEARFGNTQNETPDQKGATNTAETTDKDYSVKH